MKKADIQNRGDIELLVNLFYDKVKEDNMLSPVFNSRNIDWAHHLPIMYGFWEFILFSKENAYTGNVMNPHFKVHANTPLNKEHFAQWLRLFTQTVDENFEGDKAEEAKSTARSIGLTMQYKVLGPQYPQSGLTVTKLTD